MLWTRWSIEAGVPRPLGRAVPSRRAPPDASWATVHRRRAGGASHCPDEVRGAGGPVRADRARGLQNGKRWHAKAHDCINGPGARSGRSGRGKGRSASRVPHRGRIHRVLRIPPQDVGCRSRWHGPHALNTCEMQGQEIIVLSVRGDLTQAPSGSGTDIDGWDEVTASLVEGDPAPRPGLPFVQARKDAFEKHYRGYVGPAPLWMVDVRTVKAPREV